MNGELNDTMDEPMDTVPPTDTGTKKHSESESMECESQTNCSNSNGPNDRHSEDSDTEEEFHDSIEHEISNKTNFLNTTVPISENSDNLPQDNHCSNSNESYQDSVETKDVNGQGQKSNTLMNQENTATNSLNTLLSHAEDTEDNDDELSEEEIDSDSEVQEIVEGSNNKLNDSDIILIENSPLKLNGKKSSDIQEITSDPEDYSSPKSENKTPTSDEKQDEKPTLRRSSRSIKRLSYKDDNVSNGDNSDLEVIAIDETTSKNNAIVISDTKKLFDMAAKHKPNSLKPNQTQLVIIDSNSRKESSVGKMNCKSTSNASIPQNIYQSIAARGTTVTPVPARVPAPAPAAAPAPPPILPSLTDDMFVVEAPSFIVPYVYEKPSIKPFREFVDILGKQLDEEKAKEQKLSLENEKKIKEKKGREKKERKEKGEEVSDSEEDDDEEAAAAKQKKLAQKAAKKARRDRQREQEEDGSWDGESSDESEDIPSDEDVLESKRKENSIAKLEGVVSNLATDKAAPGKPDSYFDCSLGKFFIDVGTSLVQEHVQADLLKQQTRKLYREKKSGHSTRETQTAIASLMKNIEFSKENNAPFSFTQQKCGFCSFKTESSLVMANHLETPHMKNNLYHCNFCEFAIRNSAEIVVHMERVHAVRGRLERAPAYHPCASCPFEDNGKGKLARHLVSCAKKFRPEVNLAPPVEWEPPAKLPKMIKMKTPNYPTNFKNMGMNMSRQMMNMGLPPNSMRPRQRAPMLQPARPGYPSMPVPRGAGVVRHNLPTPVLISNYPGQNKPASGKSQPSISITPLPRAPQPQPQTSQHQAKGSFVICEICDGYIKDLEQLRNHMQWIHKVKIHPKMIYNRPPLNCQKCQFRFFTDQGLERHLLGSHGLVTSSMQEAANKGKDAGRCPVCGRVYQWKLLNHVARDHNLTLKPAHLSYKCTVCTATFGMYKQFENHVYSAHRVVAKRVMDKNKVGPPGPKPSDSLLKPMKINDEITIIPQPAKPAATTSKGK